MFYVIPDTFKNGLRFPVQASLKHVVLQMGINFCEQSTARVIFVNNFK